ncbi:MAG: ATP-dependent protease ATPase subunit HslU [Alphaproteobacteria bacterium]
MITKKSLTKKAHQAELTPREIVEELNKFVVGQNEAKRAVAIALRNRWRRKHVAQDLQEEIYPHNILMVGPTGVGKTEIARRLAKLVKAPFIKVEATKFTEVGYVGRDVDSIVRDIVDISINLHKEALREEVENEAVDAAKLRILAAVVGEGASEETKAKFAKMLDEGALDDKDIEINISDAPHSSNSPFFDIPGVPGGQMGIVNIGDMLGKALGGQKTRLAKMKVKDAYKIVLREESDKLLDDEKLTRLAISSVENDGIVFLDEIDKICSRYSEGGGKGEVSREGVQRDLLPELQGRLPIRVALKALSEEDLYSILVEPKHSLIKQYMALFAVEDVKLEFKEDGIRAIAKIAAEVNREVENIGARRLHTILEKLLESINFTASDTPGAKIEIDKAYVDKYLAEISPNSNLSNFIL